MRHGILTHETPQQAYPTITSVQQTLFYTPSQPEEKFNHGYSDLECSFFAPRLPPPSRRSISATRPFLLFPSLHLLPGSRAWRLGWKSKQSARQLSLINAFYNSAPSPLKSSRLFSTLNSSAWPSVNMAGLSPLRDDVVTYEAPPTGTSNSSTNSLSTIHPASSKRKFSHVLRTWSPLLFHLARYPLLESRNTLIKYYFLPTNIHIKNQ